MTADFMERGFGLDRMPGRADASRVLSPIFGLLASARDAYVERRRLRLQRRILNDLSDRLLRHRPVR
jgi:hypothetical protein